MLTYAKEQNRAVITLNRLDFIRLHQETQGNLYGIIFSTRDDADRAAFAQRIQIRREARS